MAAKSSFYAVHTGKTPGVYTSWEECQKQVKGFSGAKFKKFSNRQDAEFFAEKGSDKPLVKVCGSEESSDDVIIYTDGACSNNGNKDAKAGVGIYFGDNHELNVSEPLPRLAGIPTNQLAELYAIYWALYLCLEDKCMKNKNIIVYTDSQYSINCLTTWFDSWQKKGWKTADKKPVKHIELIRQIKHIMEQLNVRLVHVKGHNNNYGNDQADLLAVSGAERY